MNKYLKLGLSVLLDTIGMLPSFAPMVFEGLDLAWAPISYVIMNQMYKGKVGKIAGMVSVMEELLPATDFVPTFTLTWFYVHVTEPKKQEEQIIDITNA